MSQLISNVLMQPKPDAVEGPLTLVEKLEHKESEISKMMQADDAPFPYYYMAGQLNGVREAIAIVKQHSDWVRCDERLPYAEEMLTNHYEPKEFYEIILKTGELLIASYTHMKNDGNNEILFMDCTIALTDGEWGLLDGGFSVYEVDEVAYWKPIKPPSEVQA